ncbi:unnamed protein product [Kuraishia capsulata CBS 1993]|uniref:TIGR01456 family HAD hydrolase n=1 Tax=Kuraishia capsulata CBS 1993 TaxID=1382522 RepID=W6MKC3_9ASCO|nr:uncharacterized protein KUCA_T00001064001 [Kuraishia capsulata CBS 1993]CDK25097.1 unnamed protein product [Kuraishia capsulata CBS 1993]
MNKLRFISRQFVRFSSSNNIAFAFDIDGVLLRGSKPLNPYAKTALTLLDEHKVPYVLFTNGGGVSESDKIREVAKKLEYPTLTPGQIILSHSPFKKLTKSFSRVFVVGGKADRCRRVALDYGFREVLISADYIACNPGIAPFHKYHADDELALDPKNSRVCASKDSINDPVDCILVFNDSWDSSADIQIVLDLLNSEHGKIGTFREGKYARPSIPIYFSNGDFLWANDFKLPRFGQGGFKVQVEALYEKINGVPLESTTLGKPERISYEFAHHVLCNWSGTTPDKVYMVGDNPNSDIHGANAFGWESILVRTGVFKDSEIDYYDHLPTLGIFDNVETGVRKALEDNGIIGASN